MPTPPMRRRVSSPVEGGHACSQIFDTLGQAIREPPVALPASQWFGREREQCQDHAGPEQRRGQAMSEAGRPPAPSPGRIGVARESIPDDEPAEQDGAENRRDDAAREDEVAGVLHTFLDSKPRAVTGRRC